MDDDLMDSDSILDQQDFVKPDPVSLKGRPFLSSLIDILVIEKHLTTSIKRVLKAVSVVEFHLM